MNPPTFRERYAARWSIAPEQFETHLLGRVLYLHARPLGVLMGLGSAFFAADRDFLRCVGDIRTRRFFHAEAGEFHGSAANRKFHRKWLRLRASAERVRMLMEDCWPQGRGGATSAPGREVSSR